MRRVEKLWTAAVRDQALRMYNKRAGNFAT
jgi:hypothetical protein